MAAIVEDGKLRLSGYVGDYYFEDGFTSGDVVVALGEIDADSDLAVHINSPGGVATEGAAIHALLSARAGRTDIVVEGIAASAASLIAMAGDTVTMSAGSVMMIHDPSGFTWGTSDDHSKTIEGLEALATAYARVYAAKSGKSADECRVIMKAERWLTPEQAVVEGFADATTEAVKPQAVAAFDYRLYANAPKSLVAMAKKKNWSMTTRPPMPTKTKESVMTESTLHPPAPANTPAPVAQPATAVEIMEICMAANAPMSLALQLAGEKATKEQATARANAVGQIRQMVADAGKVSKAVEAQMADDMIAQGLSVEKARETLFAKLVAAQSPEIDTQIPQPQGATKSWASVADTINKRRG